MQKNHSGSFLNLLFAVSGFSLHAFTTVLNWCMGTSVEPGHIMYDYFPTLTIQSSTKLLNNYSSIPNGL